MDKVCFICFGCSCLCKNDSKYVVSNNNDSLEKKVQENFDILFDPSYKKKTCLFI